MTRGTSLFLILESSCADLQLLKVANAWPNDTPLLSVPAKCIPMATERWPSIVQLLAEIDEAVDTQPATLFLKVKLLFLLIRTRWAWWANTLISVLASAESRTGVITAVPPGKQVMSKAPVLGGTEVFESEHPTVML